MTDTMVERVARAICEADERNGAAPWDWYGSDKARSGYFDQARAAVQAAGVDELAEALEIMVGLVDSGFYPTASIHGKAAIARHKGE